MWHVKKNTRQMLHLEGLKPKLLALSTKDNVKTMHQILYRDNTQKLTNNSLGIIFKLVMYKIVLKQAEILEIVNCRIR